MAKLSTKGQIKGSVGPVSYHVYNDTVYIQSKPGKGNVKQTVATQKSASDFGRASSIAKAIRNSLFPILQNHSDNEFYRRFTARINTATQDGNPQPKGNRSLIDGNLSLLTAIDCNTASPFDSYCNLTPLISLSSSRQLIITLPEFLVLEHISAPAEATDAVLVFLVTAIHPDTNSESHSQLFKLELPLKDSLIPAQEWTSIILPEGQLILVASAVFYYRNNTLAGMVGLNGKEFHPCEVSRVLRG